MYIYMIIYIYVLYDYNVYEYNIYIHIQLALTFWFPWYLCSKLEFNEQSWAHDRRIYCWQLSLIWIQQSSATNKTGHVRDNKWAKKMDKIFTSANLIFWCLPTQGFKAQGWLKKWPQISDDHRFFVGWFFNRKTCLRSLCFSQWSHRKTSGFAWPVFRCLEALHASESALRRESQAWTLFLWRMWHCVARGKMMIGTSYFSYFEANPSV